MSKVGTKPVVVPSEVKLEITGGVIKVVGKEGEISLNMPKKLTCKKDNDNFVVERSSDNKEVMSTHGLFRSLVANAVAGVQKPWEKKLEVVGTGFNVKLQGEDLVLKIGFSHPVVFKKIAGIKYSVQGNNKIIVSGVDKQLVGQVAYQIKKVKKPDAYKGKGIRYDGEKLRIKPGKKVKTTTAG